MRIIYFKESTAARSGFFKANLKSLGFKLFVLYQKVRGLVLH